MSQPAIVNERTRTQYSTRWKMERVVLGARLKCSFMYSHEMMESAHLGRKMIADKLRHARDNLRAEAAKLKQ